MKHLRLPLLFLLFSAFFVSPVLAQLTFDPANPPSSGTPPTEQYNHYTGAFSHQKGPKSVLVILVQPSDGAAWSSPPTFSSLDSSLNSASQNFYNASYRQTWFGPKRHSGFDIPRLVVTPVLILPKTADQYRGSFGTLQADCLAAVRAQGGDWNGGRFDPNYYDRWVVMSNTKMIGSTGLAYVGGRFAWTGGAVSGGVAEHEWGHNWGVYHANDWTVPVGEHPRSSAGSNGEYQDGWDLMGGNNSGASFNPQFRENLGFLERSRGEAQDITASGTYRIHNYIHPYRRQDAGLVRALVIPMSSFTDPKRVILGFGHVNATDGGLGRADWNRNAVTVHSKLATGSNRIDTTPYSRQVGDANDSSIKIGRTYSEGPNVNGTQMYGGFHVTPVARGNTVFNGVTHEWIDVVVNYQNAISNNLPPTVSFPQTVITGATPGTPFSLSVTASDPNGDTLAYDWDFGDDTYNIVNSPNQSKTWASAGLYLIRCTVTDMKGGLATAYAWVSVGAIDYREASTTPTASGLHYRAYSGTWSALPDFDLLNPVAFGTVNGLNLSVRPSNNNFAILYTGYIDIPEQDVYQFSVTCDDGVRLFIGDQLVVENDGLKGVPVTRVGNIALQSGKHPIRLEYFNKDNTATLQVQWWRVSQPSEPIPSLSLVQPTWVGNEAPSVAISSPTVGENFIVNSDISITAHASDDGALTRVVFFVNSAFLAEATTPPYATVWPKAPVGTHTLTAIAYDTTGRWTRSSPLVFEVVSPPPTNGIGVNFGGTTATNTLFFNEGVGAVYAYSNWNNVVAGSSASLNDHNGSPTPTTVATGGSAFSNNAETTTAPGKFLVSGLYRRFDIEPADFPNPSALISDIPYAVYDVYVYVDPPETSGNDASANRIVLTPSEGEAPAPRFVRNSVAAGDGVGDYPTYDTFTGFREATATSLYDAPEKIFGNYVVFRGLTASGFFVESTRRNGSTLADGTTGRHDRYLNAIQIIETVPTAPSLIVRQTAGGTAVSEQGEADSITVALAFLPTDTVTVSVQPDAQLTADKATLTFTPANWNVAQSITIGAVNDTTPEGPHTGALMLIASGGNYTGLDPRVITVAIEDNDQAAVSVHGSGFLREGNAATASFVFTRSGLSSLTSPTTVSFQMSGTAAFSGDYTFSGAFVSFNPATGAGTVVIPAGQSQVFLIVSVVNDSTREYTETAILTIESTSSAAAAEPNNAVLVIYDDDVTDYLAETFNSSTWGSRVWDINNRSITFTPAGSTYTVTTDQITEFPSGTTGFTNFNKASMSSGTAWGGWWSHSLAVNFNYFGVNYSQMFVSTEGVITFGSGSSIVGSITSLFGNTVPKIAPFWSNLDPGTTGEVAHRRISDGGNSRTVIFYNAVRLGGTSNVVISCQVELFDDGRIRYSYLNNNAANIAVVVGLASGVTNNMPSSNYTDTASPRPFYQSDFTLYQPSTTGNRVPTFSTLSPTSATAGQLYSYSIVAADPDLAQPLTFTAPVKPAWLTLTDHGNRSATFSGTPSLSGSFPVTLQVTDGIASTQQVFTLLVVPAVGNTTPTFTSSLGTMPFGNVGELFSYAVSTADADGHALTLSAVELPGWLTFTPTGPGTATLSGVIPDNDISTYPIALVVSDGLASSAQSFTLSVNRAPRVTLLEPISGVVFLPDVSLPLQLVAEVSDDGQPASPGLATVEWIQIEGPAPAIFADSAAVSTSVTFPTSGVYRLRLSASDGALSSHADVHVFVELSPVSALSSGLRGHWKFNDDAGSVAVDSSGQGRDLTLTGSSVFGPGVEGSAYVTTASNIQYGENATLPYAAQTTWSAWVRSDVSPNDSSSVRVLFTHVDGSNNARTRLGLKNTSSQLIFHSPHQTQGVWETTTYRLPANEWVHLVLTYDNGDSANHPVLYADGDALALTRTTAPSGSLNASIGLRLAGRSSTNETWKGRMDEVRLYDRILTPAELALLPLVSPPNQAPLITAALRDPIEEFANTGVLIGTVEDDGLPAVPGEVTTVWSQVSGAGAVKFADTSALETAVSFDASGSYVLRLTANDGEATTSADVVISVSLAEPVATSVALSPAEITVRPSTAQTFTAVLFDQYNRSISPQPAFVWSVSGGGIVNSTGQFTAGITEGGPYSISATASSVSGTAQVTIFNHAPTISPISNQTLAIAQVLPPITFTVDDVETSAANLTVSVTSSNQTLLPAVNLVVGGSGADRTLTLTPVAGQTGSSTVTLQVSDGHKTSSRIFTFTVQSRVATTVSVTPAVFSLPPQESGIFAAVVLDQVGEPVSPQPEIVWTVSGGGSIDAMGLFNAGAINGGPHTVTATFGALSGTAAVTIRAAGAYAWTGAVSSDWHDPANWSAFVPGPSDVAVFDAPTPANQPEINGTARVRGLRFLSTSGAVEISGGSLELGIGGILNGGQIRGTTTLGSTLVLDCDPLIISQIAALLALNESVIISGTRIPAGTTIAEVSGTSLTLSQAATGNGTNTFSLNSATASPITISSDVVLTAAQAWQLSHNGTIGSVLTVSGNLSGSGDMRIGGSNASNGTNLPWLRLTGSNDTYTGTISFSSPQTQGSAGLLLGSASSMTGGLIHLDSPTGQNYNLWLTGGVGSGAYTFGINGTETTGARIQTRSGNAGIFTTGGTVAWDPGSDSDYTWSAPSGVTYLTIAGTDGSKPSPLEIGNPSNRFIIGGSNKTFASSGAGNYRGQVVLRSALSDANEATARTLTTTLRLLRLTQVAVNQHATARLNLSITGGTVAISDPAQLPGGNLNLNGGTLLLDGVTWEQFTAARPQGTGNNEWQAGGSTALAARGESSLAISANLNTDVSTLSFGSSARAEDGVSAFANRGIHLTQDIVYSDANRVLQVAGALRRINGAGAYTGFDVTPIHEISGVISGLGADKFLILQGVNNGDVAEGESGGILRLSAVNTFTGTIRLGHVSPTGDTANPQGFGALLATSDAAFGNVANSVVVSSVNNRGWALLLEDPTSLGRTFSRPFHYEIRGSGNSQGRSWAFGSYAGLVNYTGTLTVAPQSGQTLANNTTYNLNLHAETHSTLALGAPGTPATLLNQVNTANTANITNLQLRKTGPGHATLNNFVITPANANANHYWDIQDGVLRETGISATNSLNGARLALSGGVLETKGEFMRALGTAASQIQWFSGGFAARGGDLTVTIDATTPNTEWQDTHFLANGGALVLGSTTADAAVFLTNSIALANADNLTVTREIRVIDNPASLADRAVILANLRNRGDGGDGGIGARNLLKAGDGLLELSGDNSEFSGHFSIEEGTLIVSGKVTSQSISVSSGASLGGTGTINSSVELASGARLKVHLATDANNHSRLSVGDRLNFASGAEVHLTAEGNPAGTYTLVRATGGISGDLPTLVKPTELSAYLQISGMNLLLVIGTPPNSAPTISQIPTQSFAMNSTPSPIPFTVTDTQTAAELLTVTVASSNTTLIPENNLVMGGAGTNRSLSITPAVDQSGTALITVTVSDGELTAQTSFTVTVMGGFAAWIAHPDFGLSGEQTDILADPDSDGIPNLLEYALGGNPVQADTSILPLLSITHQEGQGYLTLTVSKNQHANDLNYIVETSQDLENWQSGVGHTVFINQTESELVVRSANPISVLPNQFLRLRVSE